MLTAELGFDGGSCSFCRNWGDSSAEPHRILNVTAQLQPTIMTLGRHDITSLFD